VKLFYSATSPFVRKCLVAAHELGLSDRIELLPVNVSPVKRDRTVVASNPLGQVPTLITDDGAAIYDSRVIFEYLNALAGGALMSDEGEERWKALTEQALADGMLDAAILARYETAVRPENLRWKEWTAGQIDKITCGLDELEKRAADFGDRVDLGTISFACALAYLDLRYQHLEWRQSRPNAAAWFEWFGGRESMVTTRPPAA